MLKAPSKQLSGSVKEERGLIGGWMGWERKGRLEVRVREGVTDSVGVCKSHTETYWFIRFLK